MVIFFTWTLIYNLFFSPLSKYPGPKLAAISEIPYLYWTLSGKSHTKWKELHDKYGDVVRTGPRRLVYRSANAWKDIYGHRKAGAGSFLKDPKFYAINPTGPNLINSNDADHARERRLLSHAFSEKALREQESLVQHYVDSFIEKLDGEIAASRETVEMTKWFNFTTFDIIGDLVFGEPFDCLKNKDYHPWVQMAFAGVKGGVFQIPILIYPLLKPIYRKLLAICYTDVVKKRETFYSFSKEKMDRRINTKTTRPDFMTHVLSHSGDRAMSVRELQSNAALLIIAGSETTATLLSGFAYYITMNPDVYKKVVAEVRKSFNSYEEIGFNGTNNLPYLLATLEETLRMFPPVPGAFSRVVPKGGALIDGEFIPEGVAVAGAHLSTYHCASNFADAESFIPERWLPDRDEKFESDNRDILHAFSLGPRNCLGKK